MNEKRVRGGERGIFDSKVDRFAGYAKVRQAYETALLKNAL